MEKLICFDKLIVEKPKISKDSFLTNYIIEKNGKREI